MYVRLSIVLVVLMCVMFLCIGGTAETACLLFVGCLAAREGAVPLLCNNVAHWCILGVSISL